ARTRAGALAGAVALAAGATAASRTLAGALAGAVAGTAALASTLDLDVGRRRALALGGGFSGDIGLHGAGRRGVVDLEGRLGGEASAEVGLDRLGDRVADGRGVTLGAHAELLRHAGAGHLDLALEGDDRLVQLDAGLEEGLE